MEKLSSSMNPANICQAMVFDDLRKLLKHHPIIILAVVGYDCNETLKTKIRKSMKTHSKVLRDVQFVYYVSTQIDHSRGGRLNPILDGDIRNYPKLFCIKNASEILFQVAAIDNATEGDDAMSEFFDVAVTEYRSIVAHKARATSITHERDEKQSTQHAPQHVEQDQVWIDESKTSADPEIVHMKIDVLRHEYERRRDDYVKSCISRRKKEEKLLRLLSRHA